MVQNNFCTAYATRYGMNFLKTSSNDFHSNFDIPETFGDGRFISNQGNNYDKKNPCIVVEKTDPLFIGEGMHIEFSLDTDLFFGNDAENGCNGGVSFLWYTNNEKSSLGTEIIPDFNYAFSYNETVRRNLNKNDPIFAGAGLFQQLRKKIRTKLEKLKIMVFVSPFFPIRTGQITILDV